MESKPDWKVSFNYLYWKVRFIVKLSFMESKLPGKFSFWESLFYRKVCFPGKFAFRESFLFGKVCFPGKFAFQGVSNWDIFHICPEFGKMSWKWALMTEIFSKKVKSLGRGAISLIRFAKCLLSGKVCFPGKFAFQESLLSRKVWISGKYFRKIALESKLSK